MENNKSFDYYEGLFDAYGDIAMTFVSKADELGIKENEAAYRMYTSLLEECFDKRNDILAKMHEIVFH